MTDAGPDAAAEDAVERTSVLVVGGGPVGLALAALLGRFGVPVVLVERRSGVNPHPRARSINVRTAELFRQWGLLGEIEAVSLPKQWGERFVYTQTLAGRELGRTEMNVQPVVDGRVLSPAPWLLSSQDQIEPVIARYAASLPGVELRYGHELVALAPEADGATVTLAHTDGSQRRLRADWVVAADGAASRVRQLLEVAMEGGHNLATLVNCHFTADLSRFTDARPAALYWTTAPARNVFQKIDTNDRWLCQLGYDAREHRAEDFTRDTAAEWIRRSIGASDAELAAIDLRVIDVIPWTMSSTVAERFRVGRVLLAGDAAHQLPPSGGFGMNTGVQDTHNLAWKLAYVLRGWAEESLLDSYDVERRPIARYNADRSMENTRHVGRIRKLVERGRDEDVAEAVSASARYGNWLGMDLGVHYEAGCLIPDGTERPAVEDPVSDYEPSARPGARAPHAEIVLHGRRGSTLDLYDDRFVLLAGPEAGRWVDAATALGHPALVAYRIGVDVLPAEDGDDLLARHGLEPDGVVLVRPDGHVAWRRAAEGDDGFGHDARSGLASVLGTLLGGAAPR